DFWENFTFQALNALAVEARGSAAAAFQELKKKARFPIARPKAGEEPLSAADVVNAQSEIRRIRAGDPAKAGEAAPPAATIQGLPKRFQDAVNMLRGGDFLSTNDRDWLESVERVLKFLPTDASDHLKATISVSDKPLEGDDAKMDIPFIWPNMEIVEGG